jgi:hypothetical protein
MKTLSSSAAQRHRDRGARQSAQQARIVRYGADHMLEKTKEPQVEVEKPTIAPSAARPDLDRLVRSSIMGATLGRSPLSLLNAYMDWLGHLMVAGRAPMVYGWRLPWRCLM